MSTVVSIDKIWINTASNPSDYMAFESIDSLTRNATQGGQVTTLAGGRQRLIRKAGNPREWSVQLTQSSRVQLDWLESHIGETVCVRDHRGHKIFAVYLSLSLAEDGYYDDADTSLTLSELTISEAV